MLRDGLVAIFFTGLAMMLPYLAIGMTLSGLMAVTLGLSQHLATFHQNLGTAAGVLGGGGVGLAMLAGVAALAAGLWFIVPLLQARYAATGQISSYFRLIWAGQTIWRAPLKFLLYQVPTLLLVTGGTLLHFLTLGLGTGFLMLAFPFVQLNQAYLMGHYYGEYVDPSLGDNVVPQS